MLGENNRGVLTPIRNCDLLRTEVSAESTRKNGVSSAPVQIAWEH